MGRTEVLYKSLLFRLVIISVLPVVVLGVCIAFFVYLDQISKLEEREISQIHALAESISLSSEFALTIRNIDLLRATSESAFTSESITKISFYDSANQLITVNENDRITISRLNTVELFLSEYIARSKLLDVLVKEVYLTELKIEDSGYSTEFDNKNSRKPSAKKVGTLHFSLDFTALFKRQFELILKTVIMLLITISLGCLFSAFLAFNVGSPIRLIIEKIKKITDKIYEDPIVVRSTSEIEELAHGINELSSELNSFHSRLTEAVHEATSELNLAMGKLEQKNHELTESRIDAEKANSFKSAFLANMSHELRTPLNTIIGMLSLVEKDSLPHHARSKIEAIESSSDSLLSLIHQLLDISKIEAGYLILDEEVCEIDHILHDIHESMVVTAVEKNLELHIASSPVFANLAVLSDKLRIKQVLINLMSNALKFTSKGHVSISTTAKKVDDNYLSISFSVSDTGIGIADEEISEIFTPFFQSDMTTKRNYGGVGLGLYICKEIIDSMSGSISVKSVPNVGTTFTVNIQFKYISKKTENKFTATDREGIEAIYFDSYEALYNDRSDQLANTILNLNEIRPNISPSIYILIFRIPSCATQYLDNIVLPDNFYRYKSRLALISIETLSLRKQLSSLGFDDIIVYTPDYDALNRQFLNSTGIEIMSPELPFAVADEEYTTVMTSALAVDDQVLNLRVLEEILSSINVDIVGLTAANDVMQILNERKFDVIFLDLHLPIIDGFTLAAQIRSSETLNSLTPLIAISADAFEKTRIRAMDSGFDNYLSKPVKKHQISELLRDLDLLNDRNSAIGGCPRIYESANNEDSEWRDFALSNLKRDIPDYVNKLSISMSTDNLVHLRNIVHELKGLALICSLDTILLCIQAIENAKDKESMLQLTNRLVSLLETDL